MKTNYLKTFRACLLLAAITGATCVAGAQTGGAVTNDAVAAPVAVQAPAAMAPQLPYGASQILQLAQAKVADETIVSYIRNTGNSYNLNANEIIYLHQQGVSGAVINAMLSQPRAGVLGSTAPAPAYAAQSGGYPQIQAQPQQPAPTVTVLPSVTAIDPVAASSYYYYPDYSYYYPYYYPAYYGWSGWYPGVSVSLGWGGYGWHGGGWRGGGGGGFHGGGGGFHGGGGGGFRGGGGGVHGGGGGFHR
jgi:hypothetical protein